jgi:CubicO group peptidase (beta-lactamase class C family)
VSFFRIRGEDLMIDILIAALSVVAGADPISAVDTKHVDALIERARESWQVPGAAVVIVSGDRILYSKGSGRCSKEKPIAVTPDTIFPLASCTKAFTTTLMAMLADEGKLAWDDPVRKHLKSFHLSDPLADGDARLRDLVSHRTGVDSHDLLWYRAKWDQEEMVRRVGLLPLARPFRTAMQYQSIMFVAAGQAAASAGQKPWHDLVRTRIFDPLEMKSASTESPEPKKSAVWASPHRKNGDGVVELIPFYEMPEPNPAGSIHASIRDLAPWIQLHLNDGMHGDKRLVSAASLRDTHSPQTIIPMEGGNADQHPFTLQMSYGMAWVIQDYRGELLVSHAGLIDGFRAHIALLPKRKLGLAILCNLDQTRMNLALSNSIVDLLLKAPAVDWNDHYGKIIAEEDFAAKRQAIEIERGRKHGTKPSLPLADYAGKFNEPAYGEAIVKLEKGELILEWSRFRCKLEHFHYDVFRALDPHLGQWPVQFTIADGTVKEMNAIGMRFKR